MRYDSHVLCVVLEGEMTTGEQKENTMRRNKWKVEKEEEEVACQSRNATTPQIQHRNSHVMSCGKRVKL